MTMTEIWRRVPDNGDYYVSSLGRVRAGRGQQARYLNTRLNPRGYLCVQLTGKKMVSTTLGNLVLRSFRTRPHAKAQVRYIDGNPRNCSLDNLRWRCA